MKVASTQSVLATAISEAEAAKVIGVSRTTLRSWRNTGVGPAHYAVPGGRVKYAPADLDAFAASLRVAKGANVSAS
jgi:DNA-binding transcriptional MerR regulator